MMVVDAEPALADSYAAGPKGAEIWHIGGRLASDRLPDLVGRFSRRLSPSKHLQSPEIIVGEHRLLVAVKVQVQRSSCFCAAKFNKS